MIEGFVLSCFEALVRRWCDNATVGHPYMNGLNLTLPKLRLLGPKHKDAKTFENHLNPVMLVFIG